MTNDTRWLTPAEQSAWRAFIRLHQKLEAVLGRDLQARAQLSVADFEVLVALTDAADGKRRFQDLARDIEWQQSRLSHQIARMTKRGLVTREPCPDDRRGAFVAITAEGRSAIESAAPYHVEGVRRLVIDVLTEEELATLGDLSCRILRHIDEEGNGSRT